MKHNTECTDALAAAIAGSLLIVMASETDHTVEAIWRQHRITAQRVAETLKLHDPSFDVATFIRHCRCHTYR